MDSKNTHSRLKQRGFSTLLRATVVELTFVSRVFAIALVALFFGVSLFESTTSLFRLLCAGVLIAVVAVAYPRRLAYRVHLLIIGSIVTVTATVITSRTTVWNYTPLTGMPGSALGRDMASWIRERDAVVTGIRVLRILQGITPQEMEGLEPAIMKAYEEFEASIGVVASPMLTSITLGSLVGTPDSLVFELPSSAEQNGTVVFLHGTGGNWSLGCWLVARAAARAHFETVCPSAGPIGLWGADTEGTVRRSIQQIKAARKGPVVVAGLSAGAVGVGQMGPLLDQEILGAAMLFGGHPAARGFSKPLLLMYGERDERFPVSLMRFVARGLSDSQQYVSVVEMPSADHMAIVKRSSEVEGAFADWLTRLAPPVPAGR